MFEQLLQQELRLVENILHHKNLVCIIMNMKHVQFKDVSKIHAAIEKGCSWLVWLGINEMDKFRSKRVYQ